MPLRHRRAARRRPAARRRADRGRRGRARALPPAATAGRRRAGLGRRRRRAAATRRSCARPAEPFCAEGGLQAAARQSRPRRDQGLGGQAAAPPDRGAGACLRRARKSCSRAFKAGELERDLVAVVRFQGPQANGMPELHKLTPPLGVLQDKGFKVALVTDGRMTGASGKVPAAIHVTPEAADGGPLARLRDGDIVRLDAEAGTLEALVEPGRMGGARAGHRRSVGQRPRPRPRAVRPPAARHRRRRDRRLAAGRPGGVRRAR